MNLGGARVFAQALASPGFGSPLWMARKGEASSIAFDLEPRGTALSAGAGGESGRAGGIPLA
jgi:hypothetical protein